MASFGFSGTSVINLDAKGRMTVPAKERADLKDIVIAPNIYTDKRFLLIYQLGQWEKLAEGLLNKPNTAVKEHLIRHFFGRAVECSPDSGGRVLIPKDLRDWACIDKKMALVGVGRKFELWADELHRQSYEMFINEVTNEDIRDEIMDVDY